MSDKKEKLLNILITILLVILSAISFAVPIIIACSVQRAAPLLLETWSVVSMYTTWSFWIKYLKFCKEYEGE
jgi:hypothetical protein